MPHHHKGAPRLDTRLERLVLARSNLLGRAQGNDVAGMGIASGVAVAGKVFYAGHCARAEHRRDLGGYHPHRYIGIGGKRTGPDNLVLGVGKYICNRSEIDIEANLMQIFAYRCSDMGRLGLVPRSPHLCHVRKALHVEIARIGNARHQAAALFVHRQKRRYAGTGT